jgi:hypothetical protein
MNILKPLAYSFLIGTYHSIRNHGWWSKSPYCPSKLVIYIQMDFNALFAIVMKSGTEN